MTLYDQQDRGRAHEQDKGRQVAESELRPDLRPVWKPNPEAGAGESATGILTTARLAIPVEKDQTQEHRPDELPGREHPHRNQARQNGG